MAATASFVTQPSQTSVTDTPPQPKSIKELAAKLPGQTSIPSGYTFQTSPNIVNDEAVPNANEPIPIIDFSLLTSSNPEERSKVIQDLGKACQDWGCFMVINHGVPESLIKAIIETSAAFFELPEDEKQEFAGKHVLDPINYGTSMNFSANKVIFWRDFVRLILRPYFHSINKPSGFSEIALEYGKKVRQVAGEILRGVSGSLGLEENYIEKAINLENGLQLLGANLYPRCPQPKLAMGLPPHSDIGVLTLQTQNGVEGLQVQHQGKWINVNPVPNSFIGLLGDHIEILSNGKYQSVLHRAMVNDEDARMSIIMLHGPALHAVVRPAPELLDSVSNPPAYKAMKFKDYIEIPKSSNLDPKFCLKSIRI